MGKFNKDIFLNDITGKVQTAIKNSLITKEDIESNDIERLHGFIQYELLEYITDRKCAIDVLKDFNYDEKVSWDKLEKQFGEFKSLLDIALVNLWQFLVAEGATEFGYYDKPISDNSEERKSEEHDDIPPYDEDEPETEEETENPESVNPEDEEMDFGKSDESAEDDDYRPSRRIHIRKDED